LGEARRLSPGVIIADINIDPIDTPKNQKRLALRKGVADVLFVTTAEPSLAAHVGPGAFAAFLPNPVDPSMETGRAFEIAAPPFDLLFPATDAGPREIGQARLAPIDAVAQIRAAIPAIRLSTPGVDGQPVARGIAYFDALGSARLGWSLSRRASLPLYASDRMAHMFGWGLGVLLDRRAGFERFYGPDEAAFYDDSPGLIAALWRLMADDAAARAMARAGWEKTWRRAMSGLASGGLKKADTASRLPRRLPHPPRPPVLERQRPRLQPVQPQQGHRQALRSRTDFAGAEISRQEFGSGRWRRSVEADGGHAGLDQAAALHARGGFLADETALLEVDPAQEVEIGFNGVGLVHAPVVRTGNP
jgi:hypothetical protein